MKSNSEAKSGHFGFDLLDVDDNVFDFNALLHTGTVFDHPRDVVRHPALTIAEKSAILASWASDASAIASCPALRAPDGLKAPVTIDEVLDALCELDGKPVKSAGRQTLSVAVHRACTSVHLVRTEEAEVAKLERSTERPDEHP